VRFKEARKRSIIFGSSCSSRFILATNDVAGQQLSDVEVLQAYKDQAQVERGFRFLKDPMFLASTLFLKKVERIMALLVVMTLCLLVYAALEHRIRSTLVRHGATKGKPTQRPTARWVFELFLDVHLLFITAEGVQVLVMNLKDDTRRFTCTPMKASLKLGSTSADTSITTTRTGDTPASSG